MNDETNEYYSHNLVSLLSMLETAYFNAKDSYRDHQKSGSSTSLEIYEKWQKQRQLIKDAIISKYGEERRFN